MFDISWGQLLVVGVVGAAVTGRRDLPKAFHFLGSQVGRVVGLLQGARVRADQYAAQNELKQLQNELRSGLRELDQVRMELAVAASSQGMLGRNLGTMTASANRSGVPGMGTTTTIPTRSVLSTTTLGGSQLGAAASHPGPVYNTPAAVSMDTTSDDKQTISFDLPALSSSKPIPLASLASHSEKAALEDEWEKQGIGYQTRAEQLYKEQKKAVRGPASGSELLESLIKQQLLWDQYDRVVGEQDSHVQRRIDARTAGEEREKPVEKAN